MNSRKDKINNILSKRQDMFNPAGAYEFVITSSLLSSEMSNEVFYKAIQVLYEIDPGLFFLIEKAYNENIIFDLETWQNFESCIEPKCSTDEAPILLNLITAIKNDNPKISLSELIILLNCSSLADYNNKVINMNTNGNA
jgi:hypothetical protein